MRTAVIVSEYSWFIVQLRPAQQNWARLWLSQVQCISLPSAASAAESKLITLVAATKVTSMYQHYHLYCQDTSNSQTTCITHHDTSFFIVQMSTWSKWPSVSCGPFIVNFVIQAYLLSLRRFAEFIQIVSHTRRINLSRIKHVVWKLMIIPSYATQVISAVLVNNVNDSQYKRREA